VIGRGSARRTSHCRHKFPRERVLTIRSSDIGAQAANVPEVIKKAVDAEVRAAAWMRGLGFYDAQETTFTSDGGIDVVASVAVAQVKFKAAQVGRPELQSFVGAAHPYPDRLRLFFSWKGYSANAREYAEQAQIALFTYELDGRCLAANAFANHLCTVGQGSGATASDYSVTPVPAASDWWTPRRIVQAVLGVLVLCLVIFFMIRPDVFLQLLFSAIALLMIAAGLGLTRPKKRRRRTRRR
jgi:hypothetical protein